MRRESAFSSDRSLMIAFGVSVGCHMLFLGTQLFHFNNRAVEIRQVADLDVIYDFQIAEQDVRRLRQQLAELRERPPVAPAPAGMGTPVPTIRIPDRPAGSEGREEGPDFETRRATSCAYLHPPSTHLGLAFAVGRGPTHSSFSGPGERPSSSPYTQRLR